MRTLRILSTNEEMRDAFLYEASNALEERGEFSFCVPGGNSVKGFFRELAKAGKAIDWSRASLYWADERLVPPESPESNYKLAKELFIDSLPGLNVHRFPGESEDPEGEIEAHNSDFDIVVLGVGPDGHVASLFPGSELLDAREKEYLLVEDSPKPPSRRVTISPKHILDAAAVFVFFVGEEKREAYENFMANVDYHECPAVLALEGEAGKPCYALQNL